MPLQKKILFLAALFLVGAAYLYFFELKKGDGKKSERLLNFKEEETESIVLTYPEREIRLQKETGGKWKLTQPLQAPADPLAVTSLVSALSTSAIQRTVEKKPGGEDLKNFSLNPPAVKVSVTLKSGITLPSLAVGGKTPVGNSAYVQLGSDPAVYLTGAELAFGLEKEPNDFRDRTILSFPQEQVARLQIERRGESLVFAKGEKEQWSFEAPAKKNANGAALTDYLSALADLRATTFVDDQPRELKKYGLEPPALKITADSKEGKNLATLRIGSKSGQTYHVRAEGTPTVYAIDDSSYSRLNKQLADFLTEEKPAQKK